MGLRRLYVTNRPKRTDMLMEVVRILLRERCIIVIRDGAVRAWPLVDES